jgi:hypothetical protein
VSWRCRKTDLDILNILYHSTGSARVSSTHWIPVITGILSGIGAFLLVDSEPMHSKAKYATEKSLSESLIYYKKSKYMNHIPHIQHIILLCQPYKGKLLSLKHTTQANYYISSKQQIGIKCLKQTENRNQMSQTNTLVLLTIFPCPP